MIGATATATEMQNNFGRYLNLVIGGQEVIVTKNGKEVLTNTIAVAKGLKNEKTGKYETDFIEFVCFEKKANYLKQYATKGSKLEITGKLRVDNWKDE